VKFAQKWFKSTDKFDGAKLVFRLINFTYNGLIFILLLRFFTTIDGVQLATPLLLCLVCIELSDVVFAFDSVPAVFGVTQDPFIVYTSNLFAICSLRSLYGVLSNAIEQLKYLEKAVGVVLAIIATKLTASTFNIELLSPLQSLLIVVSILGAGAAYSVYDAENKSAE